MPSNADANERAKHWYHTHKEYVQCPLCGKRVLNLSMKVHLMSTRCMLTQRIKG
jgi:DNA-directed RNA polymerase subunit RPC12/RpoP